MIFVGIITSVSNTVLTGS